MTIKLVISIVMKLIVPCQGEYTHTMHRAVLRIARGIHGVPTKDLFCSFRLLGQVNLFKILSDHLGRWPALGWTIL